MKYCINRTYVRVFIGNSLWFKLKQSIFLCRILDPVYLLPTKTEISPELSQHC